jgi:hypothetical protein
MLNLADRRHLAIETRRIRSIVYVIAAFLLAAASAGGVRAQENTPANSNASPADLAKQISDLQETVRLLQSQMKEMQAKLQSLQPVRVEYTASAVDPTGVMPAQPGPADGGTSAPAVDPSLPAGAQSAPAEVQENTKAADILGGTTLNFLFDGYYAWNFNNPIGRVNLLRAYDVSSNAFSLNQADVVIENAPDPDNGKRYGARLDLQFGQATETLQGNAANEPRPEVYRNIFQAYGTYVLPIGTGLSVDFGKWASSLGIEGNFTKDQMNYSRSFWFNFLPFYHMGARLHYQVNSILGLNYWVTNGTQQTEPFNGYKDELFGFVLTPTKTLNWTFNYYLGQEHPDFQFVTNGPADLPTLQGQPFEPILNPPSGKTNIFDTYATWNVTPNFTVAGEADYVVERLLTTSLPSHTDGGAGYLRYQLTPKIALAARAEYLSDRGGLFTGATQAVKEGTLTFEYKFYDGFLMREEYRHDWSNQPYFLSDQLFLLKPSQTTATIGLVWWFGRKQGAW